MTTRPEAVAAASYQGCFSSLGCPDFSLEEAASLAAEFEVPCLELRALEGRTDLPALLSSRPGGLLGISQFICERNLQIRVLGTSFKLTEPTPQSWQELREFATLAEALNVPYLRAFGGGAWGTPLTDEDYATAAQTLNQWESARQLQGWNVRLLIETHDAFSASPPCLRLMEIVGRPLEFIWDSHHTWRLGHESPEQTWTALAPFVRHVHLKDSIGVPSARHPFTYVLPNHGEMPGMEVLALLRRDAFAGAVSLEWEKLWHPYLPPLADALQACRESGWH